VIDLATEYGASLWPREVRPGDRIRIFGTTYRGEDGRWAPSRKIEIWWDYGRQDGPPGSGDSSLIGTIEPGLRCRFNFEAVVPDSPPGRYPVQALVYDRDGFGYFGWWRVRVNE
jgi:hypothetical protein